MGVIDSIKDRLSNIPGYTKPLTDVSKALNNAGKTAPTPAPVGAKTPQQAAYEAKMDAMNKNNPYYKAGNAVPRCKGGSVMAGGHRAKGEPVKKGEALWNGQPVKKV